ncbi:hypothetical protein BRC2024_KCUCJSVR_CDS_0187 [Acinetobacter phage vB_AbaM_KissB]
MCANCFKFYPQLRMMQKDWCMCSTHCGMEYRGISYMDFL